MPAARTPKRSTVGSPKGKANKKSSPIANTHLTESESDAANSTEVQASLAVETNSRQLSLAVLLKVAEFAQRKGIDWHAISLELSHENAGASAGDADAQMKDGKVSIKKAARTQHGRYEEGSLTGADLCELLIPSHRGPPQVA
jgi:hypothetical protein